MNEIKFIDALIFGTGCSHGFTFTRMLSVSSKRRYSFDLCTYLAELTEKDKELVDEVIKKYGENFTATENEVPWSRGKRDANATSNTPYCVLIQPDERTTGKQH